MKSTELAHPEVTPQRWFFDFPDMRRWFEALPSRFTDFAPMKLEQEVVDGNFVVRAEMPGIDPDKDAEVWVADGMLHIRAERKFEEKTEKDGTFRSEFQYGSFHRTVALPKGATADDVKATYKDGVLEVRLPMRQATDPVAKVPIART